MGAARLRTPRRRPTRAATRRPRPVATRWGNRWDGFLQPVNDTAHQVGQSISIFKAGSTVPAKFVLKRSDGTVVQANTLPGWPTPAKGSSMSMPVDESAYTDLGDTGTTYRWDGSQYIYNWKTGTGGKSG